MEYCFYHGHPLHWYMVASTGLGSGDEHVGLEASHQKLGCIHSRCLLLPAPEAEVQSELVV